MSKDHVCFLISEINNRMPIMDAWKTVLINAEDEAERNDAIRIAITAGVSKTEIEEFLDELENERRKKRAIPPYPRNS